jgi:hypothetical protein
MKRWSAKVISDGSWNQPAETAKLAQRSKPEEVIDTREFALSSPARQKCRAPELCKLGF